MAYRRFLATVLASLAASVFVQAFTHGVLLGSSPAVAALEDVAAGGVRPISSATGQDDNRPPTEFVTQILEPTGGRIDRPKDWYYREGHRGPVYMWTLSREDTSGGRNYTTGLRIQMFTGVKRGTGKTAKQFILDFGGAKKERATVIRDCDETDQGLFSRVCLETEEGPFHILYSLYWGNNDLDIAVVVIAGTTRELWTTYAPTFDRMAAFELIDMKRVEK